MSYIDFQGTMRLRVPTNPAAYLSRSRPIPWWYYSLRAWRTWGDFILGRGRQLRTRDLVARQYDQGGWTGFAKRWH